MSEWRSRRARTGDRGRLLCGYMVNGRSACPETVAQHQVGDSVDPLEWVHIPPGLTHDGSSAEYRWSRYAKARRARGEDPRLERSKQWPPRDVLRGTAMVGGDSGRVVRLPCPRGHPNIIDIDVLRG